jgi:hypothetical protein
MGQHLRSVNELAPRLLLAIRPSHDALCATERRLGFIAFQLMRLRDESRLGSLPPCCLCGASLAHTNRVTQRTEERN